MKLDFRPDFLELNYGTLTECVGFVPTEQGYAVASAADAFYAATTLAGDCLGARAIKTESGSVRIFFGSDAKIEEYIHGTGYVDRSKAGGYSTGSNRWWFTQGLANSEVIATNYADAMQKSTGTGFSDLSGAPKAKIVLAQSNALLALNYDEGTAVPNGIATCTRGDSTNWTTGASSEAVRLKLVESPGEIVAGATLHDVVVAWKRNSMYVGRFVGGDEIWQFNLLSPNVGCYGMEAWCATPAGIVFAGEAGVYLFDGSVPRPIDQGIRYTIQDKINATNGYGKTIQMALDDVLGCVFIYIPDPGSNLENSDARFSCYAYNYKTNRWSHPYPFKKDSVQSGTDWGATDGVDAYTDFQAVVRDWSVVDAKRVRTGWNPLENYGHFVIPSQKVILVMNSLFAEPGGGSTALGVEACMTTGRIKVGDRWDEDAILRRVSPIWTNTSFKYGTGPVGTQGTYRCSVFSNEWADLRKGGTVENTFTWSADDLRFDGFAVGKSFQIEIATTDNRYAIADFWVDVGRAGKT